MAFVEKTIKQMEEMTRAEKKAYFEGDGKPPKPAGYDALAADDANKLAYDESIKQNLRQIAGIQESIDAGN
jgi:hypothetical protein